MQLPFFSLKLACVNEVTLKEIYW